MKFPKAISLLLLSSVEARRGSPQEIYTAVEEERDLSALMEITSCFDSHEFEVYFQGKCTFDELASRMDLMLEESGGDCLSTGELEVLSLLGLNATDIEEGRESVKQLCKAAMDEASTDPNMAVQWDEIAGYGGNFDQNFYDGRTFWNEEIETNVDTIVPDLASNRLKTDAERVDDFYETVAERTAFTWPEVSNFENCEINTAYCCWVSDRQANDGNGNCRTPYDSRCLNSDPAGNTELCGVNMEASDDSSSSYAKDGLSFFPLKVEGSVHCHGFAWSEDEMEADARYKANNLFYVSMYDHMYKRGYVRNVPGAPMCGCAEKMPIVERADCTKIRATEFWKFSFAPGSGFTASLDRAEIDFQACRNNDLQTHVNDLANAGDIDKQYAWRLKRNVVGTNRCELGNEVMMNDKGFEVKYENVGLDDEYGELYSIKILGGTNSGFNYLRTTSNGYLQLVADTSDDKTKWRFNPMGEHFNMYNIRPLPNAADLEPNRQYVGTDFYGRMRMTAMDTGSGREMWYFKPVPGYENTYNIIVVGGTRIGEKYLSTNTNGGIDLYHEDDLSGRQRWVVEKMTETFDRADLFQRQNVAFKKPTSQSSTGWGGYSSRAVDGNTNTNWRGGSITHTRGSSAETAWWKVYLQEAFDIEKINVFGRSDCCTSRLNGFTVKVFNGEVETFSYEQAGNLSLETQIDVIGPNGEVIVGDRVEVSLPGPGVPLSLAEVQVWAIAEI